MVPHLSTAPTELPLSHLTGDELNVRAKEASTKAQDAEAELNALTSARVALGKALARKAAHEVFGEDVQISTIIVVKGDPLKLNVMVPVETPRTGQTNLATVTPIEPTNNQQKAAYTFDLNEAAFRKTSLDDMTNRGPLTGGELKEMAAVEKAREQQLDRERSIRSGRLVNFQTKIRQIEAQIAIGFIQDELELDEPLEVIGCSHFGAPLVLVVKGATMDQLESLLPAEKEEEEEESDPAPIFAITQTENGLIEIEVELPDSLVKTATVDSSAPEIMTVQTGPRISLEPNVEVAESSPATIQAQYEAATTRALDLERALSAQKLRILECSVVRSELIAEAATQKLTEYFQEIIPGFTGPLEMLHCREYQGDDLFEHLDATIRMPEGLESLEKDLALELNIEGIGDFRIMFFHLDAENKTLFMGIVERDLAELLNEADDF